MNILSALRQRATQMRRFVKSPRKYLRLTAEIEYLNGGLRSASTQDNFQLLLDRRKLAQDKLDSM